MKARRLPDGRIQAPVRAEGPRGEIGDALLILGPGDDGFMLWDEYLRHIGE